MYDNKFYEKYASFLNVNEGLWVPRVIWAEREGR